MKVFLIGLLLLPAVSIAKSYQYDLRAMRNFLERLSPLTALPVTSVLREEAPKIIDKEVPSHFKEQSRLLQQIVFGKELIALHYCEDAGVMSAEYSASIICMNEEETNKLSPAMVKFVLAHELSHFIHEISILRNEGRSLNGTISIYQYTFEAFATDRLGPDWMERLGSEEGMAQLSSLYPEYFDLASRTHVEVDLYAALALQLLGEAVPFDEVLSSLTVSPDEEAAIDVRRRHAALSALRTSESDLLIVE